MNANTELKPSLKQSPLSRTRSAIVALTIVSLNLTSLTLAWALTLAQKPLVASVGSLPAPNIMLTVDTSGSMNFRHMPETSTIAGRPAASTWVSRSFMRARDGVCRHGLRPPVGTGHRRQRRRQRQHLAGMGDAMAAGYQREGRRYVTLAVGCTGGKHRSVAIAAELADALDGDGVETILVHRDLGRE